MFEQERMAMVASFGDDIIPTKIIDEFKKLRLENEKLKQKNEEEKPVSESPFTRFLF